MKQYTFELIENFPEPAEDKYSHKSYPVSGVYKFPDSGTLHFVDKEYGTVNSVYGNYNGFLTVTDKSIDEPSVALSLFLSTVAASHGHKL